MTRSHPRPLAPPAARAARRPDPEPDLVVLSHLRWTWVWQRPQHLVTRFAAGRAAGGARTYFVEEPEAADVAAPELRVEDTGRGVVRVWLAIPADTAPPDRVPGFDVESAAGFGSLLTGFLREQDPPVLAPDVLVYTPMAYGLAEALAPRRLAYDVMDDLASFAKAPAAMRLRQRRLLAEADVVFTGGRSLHRSVSALRSRDCHLFPSGVETEHFASAARLRRPHPRPVAGYVGVLDERLDLDLVAELAARLPDWTIRMVGPLAKIEPADLPAAPNLEYPGQVPYADLPAVLAGFDVALMPFALNEATRSISPTKTPEYLSAGLPVVSTRVPDVVADYGDIVRLADTGAGFADACRVALTAGARERERWLRLVRSRQEWDVIAAEMAALLRGRTRRAAALAGEATA